MLGGLVPTLAIIESQRSCTAHFFRFDSFPLICLEVNSNPSETYRSKRVSMMTRIDW